MTEAFEDRDLQALWQSQPRGAQAISLEQIRESASRLERAVARRNRREYVAAVFVVAAFSWIGWVAPTVLIRIGAGLTALAAIAVAYMLHRWGSAAALPDDLALIRAIDFHRAHLARQLALLRALWSWYLLPFVPGFVVFEIGQALARPERMWRVLVTGAVGVSGFIGVYLLNRRAAAGLERRIETLREFQ
jgi:hypothetical protein